MFTQSVHLTSNISTVAMNLFFFSSSVILVFLNLVSSKHQQRNLVGVSPQKFNNYLKKAAEGLRNIILNGDDELGYPIMDPYAIEDLFWEYRDGLKKHNINLESTNTSLLQGLSKFQLNHVSIRANDMAATFVLHFPTLLAKGPYKMDGFLFKNSMPMYGDGIVTLNTTGFYVTIDVNLALEQGYIIVQNVDVMSSLYDFEVIATNLMDLAPEFSSFMVKDILSDLYRKYFDEKLLYFVQQVIEEAIGGMTMEEFFEYFDYLVEQAD